MDKLRIIIGILCVTLLSACAGLWNPPTIGLSAKEALTPSAEMQIIDTGDVLFIPKAGAKAGFIFYPGAYVPPEAYAVELRAIADAGYLVIVPKMAFGLAIYNANAAQDWMETYPQIEKWALGGHSLGGAMAAQFTANHPDAIDALILWASYPPNSSDLSHWQGQATSISASLDGLSTPEKIRASKARLPKDTEFVIIQGGNHAQFGDYGAQKGDNPATISPEEQWQMVVDATLLGLKGM